MTFDFVALQTALAEFPDYPLPAVEEDGVFERVRQILAEAQAAGELTHPHDFMPLVRHVLRRQSLRTGQPALLRAPLGGRWPTRDQWEKYGVRAHSAAGGRQLIEAIAWSPPWLVDTDRPVFEDVFAERSVRLDWQRPIDPFLGEASGFSTYVSPGQREAVRSAILLPPGETLIVGLPTGSGKSFVAQAPVLARGLEGRLSLCVVPTTALVLDQARQTEILLRKRFPGRQPAPLAWHAGLTDTVREEIKAAIREGRQGILYCSPEAVTGALLPALYDCARAGLLGYLIIDEAHLVSQWGDSFRPAFQMLSGVRRGLLSACVGERFRTVLMSATLTPDTVETIEALFGPARTVRMVASIHLRPEPQFWLHQENDPAEKDRKVLEALRHAPRPFILYVTERKDAHRWLKILKAEGYRRLDCFHGETGHADRLRIIDEWAANTLDGIVATSAFGVGIDKGDVRTVLHAAVPETLDRFYQEVGRGGRDGRPSASLLIHSDADREAAYRIAAPSLIGEELAFDRWLTMYASSTRLDDLGRSRRLDLTCVPPHLRQQTDYNASWNMRTLIMMARAKMLELESEPPERIAQLDGESEIAFALRAEEEWSSYFEHAVVSLRDWAPADQAEFERLVGAERATAFAEATRSAEMLNGLLAGRSEVSELLDRLYRNHAAGRTVIVSRACGGCPQHRQLGQVDVVYPQPPAYGIEYVGPPQTSIWRTRFPHLDLRAPIILSHPDALDATEVFALLADLVALFGVREVAVTPTFRHRNPGLQTLHRQSSDGLLLLQDLQEDARWPSSYRLPRASVCDPTAEDIGFLFQLDRPLHVLIAPASSIDPWRADRRLADTGSNVLSYDQFKFGARA